MEVSKVNFVLGASVYYESLLNECSKLNIQSNWYLPLHQNLGIPENSPHYGRQRRIFDGEMAKQYGASVRDEKWIRDQSDGIFFVCEGQKSEIIQKNPNTHIFSLVVNTDFKILYPRYINNVDWIVLPNEKYVTYYNKAHGGKLHTPKNLYLGSPKYDNINFDLAEVRQKYSMPLDKPIAVVFLPKPQDFISVDLKNILGILKSKGFYVFTKSRPKDPIPEKYFGDQFLPTSYYPCTSMELVFASDIVINFDSTVTEEVVMLEKPLINFAVKSNVKPLYFLYDDIASVNLIPPFNYDTFGNHIDRMVGTDFSNEFSNIKDLYLFREGNIGAEIIKFILEL